MNEKEMRESKVPTFDSIEELHTYINDIVSQNHDYGTCCYAMSMSAVAAFNYVANKLGVSGFQASCADLDIIRRTRSLERFKLIDLRDLLYPQYSERFKSYSELIAENAEWLSKEATSMLAENTMAHPAVLAHWEMLSKLTQEVPEQ